MRITLGLSFKTDPDFGNPYGKAVEPDHQPGDLIAGNSGIGIIGRYLAPDTESGEQDSNGFHPDYFLVQIGLVSQGIFLKGFLVSLVFLRVGFHVLEVCFIEIQCSLIFLFSCIII